MELHERCGAQDVTLLCYERDGAPCHRYMIRDLIDDPSALGPLPPGAGSAGT